VTHPSPVHDSVFSSVRPLRDVISSITAIRAWNSISTSRRAYGQLQSLASSVKRAAASLRRYTHTHINTHTYAYIGTARAKEIGYQRLQAHITSRGSSPQPRSFASPARARREHAATSLRRPSRIPIPIPTPRKSACSRSRVSEAILEHQVQQSIAPAPTLLLLCQTTRPQASRSLHNASAQMRSHSAHKRWGIRCYTQAVGLIATA
jgi:hypothetical protein